MKYKRVLAVDKAHAIRLANEICTCHRMSFLGVEWTDRDGATNYLTWDEIDA